MNRTAERLAAFEAKWRRRLEAGARVVIEQEPVPDTGGSPAARADAFVTSKGLQPIGYNWELLDPAASDEEPRSALGALAGALEKDMALPKQDWLGKADARACAGEFISAFDPARLTMLTNRMEHGWHPISDAGIEWAFVAYDEERIALLLLMRD